ncbi:hypothetical protein ACIF8R_07305 [Acinetobacter sp. ABJ_C4_1]|uniref:hypothetical protein n=1 Tax=Acinetobacter sp. ABJ_C4_1 TaxID=3377080 RepID=UPI0037C97C14
MEGIKFLSEYMEQYKNDYILIGGNACALNFELADTQFRATSDLDIVLLTDGQSEEFYNHLNDFLLTNEYIGKVFNGSNSGGSAYRFMRPENRGTELPAQIELFSKKPEYFDEKKSTKLHITPIETNDGISNFSAILLDDDIYHFITACKIDIDNISTVNLECLLGLKSIAWHANEKLLSQGQAKEINVIKHPADILRISSIIEPNDYYYPEIIFNSLKESKIAFEKGEILRRINDPSLDIQAYLDYYASHAKLASS